MSQPEVVVHLVTTRDQLRGLLREFAAELRPLPEPDLEQRLTIDEAAALCRVSKTTFREWVKKGLIPAYGPGKMKSYLKSEVIMALKTKRIGKS